MKKSTLVKLALTLVAIFAFAGLNAQILTNYSATQLTEANSYQTTGKAFSLYVLPDPVFSPTYDATTNTNLGASARWTWTYPVALTGAPASGAVSPTNTVNFTVLPVGVYAISVVESNTLSGCVSATSITQTVNVIAAPSAIVTTADPAQACVAAVPAPASVVITFTENVPNGLGAFAFGINELIEEIDPSDAVIATPTASHSIYDFPVAGAGSKITTGDAGFVAATPSFTFTFNTAALAVSNGHRTRYTYTLVGASDAGGNGIVSNISHKSDFGGAITPYAFGAKTTYVAIVNPAPITGPIYHISNTYAY